MSNSDLIEKNLALVYSCANRFRNKGIEYDDLYQAGCLGLCKAANGFKEELGFKFSTYAVPVILGEIKRLFRDGGTVKVSRSMKEKARLVLKEKERLEISLGREPSLREISESLGYDEYETAELLNVSLPPVSLTLADDDGEKQTDIPVESQEENIQNILALREIVTLLPVDERKILYLRYYRGLTQTKTAEILGISQVQVSRREKKIIEKVKNLILE